jgi:hypothetical protein
MSFSNGETQDKKAVKQFSYGMEAAAQICR